MTTAEAAVLRAAIERSGIMPTHIDIDTAIEAATVQSVCGCGCATIGFTAPSDQDPKDTMLVADAMAYRSQLSKEWVGVLIYASPTGLVEMEIHTPFDGPALLLAPESVQAWPVEA
jgi:hypothetical protein